MTIRQSSIHILLGIVPKHSKRQQGCKRRVKAGSVGSHARAVAGRPGIPPMKGEESVHEHASFLHPYLNHLPRSYPASSLARCCLYMGE